MPSRALTAAPKGVKSSRLVDPMIELNARVRGLESLLESLPTPKDGSDGKDGSVGPAGRDGRDGAMGLPGPSGRDGVGFRWMGNYNQKVEYEPNDVVNYMGSSYIAVAPSVTKFPNSNTNFWNLMAAAGAAGAPGTTEDTSEEVTTADNNLLIDDNSGEVVADDVDGNALEND